MSIEILQKVKEFLVRLVKDQAFREQLQTDTTGKVRQVMQDSGYTFSKEEFETATIKILDLKEKGEFHELSEEELVGAVGGFVGRGSGIQPLYGVVIWPPEQPYPKPHPKPIDPQPLYGVITGPGPIAQPMYGVIVSTDQ